MIEKMTPPEIKKSTDEKSTQSTEAIRGRSLFVVETTAAGIAVHTALLTEENKLIGAPAVFPDVSYALTQIDELRAMVMQHFTHAAQVGAQVLAAQAQATEQEAKSSNAATKDVKAA